MLLLLLTFPVASTVLAVAFEVWCCIFGTSCFHFHLDMVYEWIHLKFFPSTTSVDILVRWCIFLFFISCHLETPTLAETRSWGCRWDKPPVSACNDQSFNTIVWKHIHNIIHAFLIHNFPIPINLCCWESTDRAHNPDLNSSSLAWL